ncbi:MAG TPA: cellulase family glycosylhydrolase [Sphingobium sp.]
MAIIGFGRRATPVGQAVMGAIALTALISGISCPVIAQTDTKGVARTRGADPLKAQPLSHDGQWLVDAAGRVVQLHGLTLYEKKAPFLEGISDQDLDYLSSQGFNSFRINWIWQAAEPLPGQYDDAYLGRVVSLNDQMARHGIRTLIGPANNSLSEKFGGFGTPLWATVNRDHCIQPGQDKLCIKNITDRYLGVDGEFEAWDNFYNDVPNADGVKPLTHFTRTWQRLASKLNGKNNIYAFDLFHEPAPGLKYVKMGERRFFDEPVNFEREGLPPFYRTVGGGVRKVNKGPTIFFQISDYYKLDDIAKAGIHVPPHFSADTNMGLSYHFGPGDLAGLPTSTFIEKLNQSLNTATNFAKTANVALVVTGFRLGKDEGQHATFVDFLDSRFIPWTYYTYRGMPDPGAEHTSLLIDRSKPASDANAKPARFDALVVPYPQLTAGTPQSWTFDRASKIIQFSYLTKPVGSQKLCTGAATEIFIPARHYPQGYSAQVKGATIVSAPTSAWLILKAERGAQKVSVTIRPRNGSYTETPATALGPTANIRCR